VRFVGSVAGKPVVTIGHADRLRSTYEPVIGTVRVGAAVRAGDPIGTVASAGGHCGGTIGCVHIGLRDDRTYYDPQRLVEPRPAVLKPSRSWLGLTRQTSGARFAHSSAFARGWASANSARNRSTETCVYRCVVDSEE
jgi:hypothetical protein